MTDRRPATQTALLYALLLTLSSILLLTGCASSGGNKLIQSGFLENYDNLKMDENFDHSYTKPDLDLSTYNAIMIDPVEIVIDPESEYKGFDPDEASELAAYFENALIEALKTQYTLAAEPGPRVLQLRTALTRLRPTKPGRNLLTTVTPTGLVISNLKRATTGSHLFVGSATVEAELLDSQTNQRLIAIVDSRAGKKSSVSKGATEWGQVKAIFDTWAQSFAKRLGVMAQTPPEA